MSRGYHVRLGGHNFGLMTPEQVKQLAASGRLTRDDELSHDGKTWVSAGTAKGLFPPAELLPPQRSVAAVKPPPIPTVVRHEPLPMDYPPQPAPAQPVPPQNIVFSPNMVQQTVVNVSYPLSNSVATIALAIAILAMLFCWIPFIGMLTMPLALLAILLAAIGFIVSLLRRGTGAASSILAGLLAVGAIAISFISTVGATAVGLDAADKAIREQNAALQAREAASGSEISPTIGDVHKPLSEALAEEPVPLVPEPAEPAEGVIAEPEASELQLDAREAQSELRTWTANKGKASIEAEFVSKGAGKVKLKKADGTIVQVEYAKLSPADREWIAQRGDRLAP